MEDKLSTTMVENYRNRNVNYEARLQWFGSRVAQACKKYQEQEAQTDHPVVWVENAIKFISDLFQIAHDCHIIRLEKE